MSKEEVQNQWRELVEEFRNSGETAAAWCRSRSLNVTQFRRWVRKFANDSTHSGEVTTVKWLSVQVEEPAEDTTSVLVVHVGSAFVEVRDGFNPLLLKQVVQALAD